MKNKNLLLISSLFMMVFVFMITVVSLFINKGISNIDLVLLALYIIGIIIFMYGFFSKKPLNRLLVFIVSTIFFLGNIISGVLGFIYFTKSSTYKKKELPKLELLQSRSKITYIISFIICMFLIFGLPFIIDNKWVDIISNIFMFIMLFIVFKDDLKRDFKYFREYFREYSALTLKYYGLSLCVMFVVNISIRMYTGLENATNQENLQLAFNNSPFLIILLAVIIAPFIEELMFRGIFRKLINNKYAYIISSGLIFGLMHVIDDFKSPQELLFILVYGTLGIFLSSLYHKTNNIFTNMMFHFMQNSLAVLAMILLSFVNVNI